MINTIEEATGGMSYGKATCLTCPEVLVDQVRGILPLEMLYIHLLNFEAERHLTHNPDHEIEIRIGNHERNRSVGG